ncbi:hypothetical protein [Demequina sp.]|uniref:hypothetical protein n=1 Tax=Demequina sp. TaxID=2050685 RepID=UPI0025C1972F|nr:hypothetical protein [Demequina sp.]
MEDVGARRASARPGTGETTDNWLAVALALLGVGVAAVAILGPLLTDVIRYHVSDGAANQIAGGDFAGLVLVAPVSLFASVLVARRHRAGAVLAMGPAAYVAYTAIQLSVGGDVDRYAGNSEKFFPLYVGLLVLALAVAIRAWSAIDVDRLPTTTRRLDRLVGWFALVVAAFLAIGLHLPGLLDAWQDQPSAPEYLADPVVFWLVKVMDLGLVVPALVAVGWGSLRGAAWAARAKYAAVGWMAMLGTAVAGMAITMQATGDPAATTANTVAFTTFAVIALAIAVAAYRPLFQARRVGA